MATDKILQYKRHRFVPLQSAGLHQQPRWGQVTCWRLTTAWAVMSTGAERFGDNAQHLPGVSSQEVGTLMLLAELWARLAGSQQQWKGCQEMPADQALSALGFLEKSFIIYRLPRTAAVRRLHRCAGGRCCMTKCVCALSGIRLLTWQKLWRNGSWGSNEHLIPGYTQPLISSHLSLQHRTFWRA